MAGWDFSILWHAARALLEGNDPYLVANFFYPLPVVYLLLPLALMPLQIAFGVWFVINFGILIASFRKAFWVWLLYVPMLHLFSSGQVELALWGMERGIGEKRTWRGALFAAIITLKPQTAIVLLPYHLIRWLRTDRLMLARWVGCTILIWGFPFIFRANWLTDWLGMRGESTNFILSASNAPGIFTLLRISEGLLIPLLIIAALIFIWGLFQEKPIARAAAMLASPVGLFYTTIQLAGCAPAWLLTPLSFIVTGLSFATNTFIPFAALPIAVIVYHIYQRKKHTDTAENVLSTA